jgi:predicted nucleic acid-binding protein
MLIWKVQGNRLEGQILYPMIAAIAIDRRLVLVTGNKKHYERIQDAGYPLKLTNWKEPD